MGLIDRIAARPMVAAILIVLVVTLGAALLPSHRDRVFHGPVPAYLKR